MMMKTRICVVSRPGPNRPKSTAAEAEDHEQRRGGRTEAREATRGSAAPSRTAAIGRNARRAHRGTQARKQRDDDADDEGDDDRAGLEREAAVREREADRVEEREQRLRQEQPEEQSHDRGGCADDERFEDDRPKHLAP